MNLNKWRYFNNVFWGINVLMVVFVVHFLLWNNEPEGYFEIFNAEGFLPQFFVNAVALLLLVMLLDQLIQREFRIGDAPVTSARKFIFYLVKVLLLPLALAIPFAYGYFWWFGGDLEWKHYVQRVLPILFLFVVFVNLVLFVRYLLLRLALLQQQRRPIWNVNIYTQMGVRIVTAQTPASSEQSNGEPQASCQISPRIQLYYKKKRLDVDREEIVSAYFADHSVRVVLRDRRICRHELSLKNFIALFEGDPHFFATGRWIVNGHFIEKLEDTYSRKKIVRLQPPYEERFELPKERVSEFRRWFDDFRRNSE